MKRAKKINALEIYQNGYQLDQWPCDTEGSNSGDEHLIEYNGKYYLIVEAKTDDGEAMLRGSEINLKEQKKEGGFIWDLIQEYEKK